MTKLTANGTRYGYLRVSTRRQDEQLQHDALDNAAVKAGRRFRFVDKGVSGKRRERPALNELLTILDPGDTIVVYKLDRLGRSLGHLADLIDDLTSRGIIVVSASEGIDSSTHGGRMMLKMLAIIAEWEREQIEERTLDGLEAARAQGRVGGRPKKLNDPKARQAQVLRNSGENVADIARSLDISIATVYRVTKARSPREGVAPRDA